MRGSSLPIAPLWEDWFFTENADPCRAALSRIERRLIDMQEPAIEDDAS
jgi:hypothetical protein